MSSSNHLPNRAARTEPRRIVRLHPRKDSFQISQGRTVLSTGLNGFIRPDTTDGLFVHQTRMLSCYSWTLDGKEPMPVALSNVEQHSWLGYYIYAPHLKTKFQGRGSGEMEEVSERGIELRISRSVGYGFHEDVDLANYTQNQVEFELQLEAAADFADQEETVRKREQFGELKKIWRNNEQGRWELFFDYHAKHHYEHQGDVGDAEIHRSVAIQVAASTTEPAMSSTAIPNDASSKRQRNSSWLLIRDSGRVMAPRHYICKSKLPHPYSGYECGSIRSANDFRILFIVRLLLSFNPAHCGSGSVRGRRTAALVRDAGGRYCARGLFRNHQPQAGGGGIAPK
jgi:hypothetical protein